MHSTPHTNTRSASQHPGTQPSRSSRRSLAASSRCRARSGPPCSSTWSVPLLWLPSAPWIKDAHDGGQRRLFSQRPCIQHQDEWCDSTSRNAHHLQGRLPERLRSMTSSLPSGMLWLVKLYAPAIACELCAKVRACKIHLQRCTPGRAFCGWRTSLHWSSMHMQ